MSVLIPLGEAVRLDAELVRAGRGASAIRLAVGEALDALSSAGGHHELGFSSFEAYARERCERTGRWAVDTRWVAQRLRPLPRIREALRAGVLGWSTAELLARHVSADSELEWLERARGMTVRELRALFAGERDDEDEDEDDERCALKVSATREDGWLFECARKVAEIVAGPMPADELLQTLLAEGYSTLLGLVPEGARRDLYELERLEGDVVEEARRRAAYRAELRKWQDEAEERSDATSGNAEAWDDGWMETDGSPEALDWKIGRLCAELAGRDLALGMLAERARKGEVWRRLGFVSEAHYARERVGVSLSSLKAKRILAGRTGRLPEIANALTSGRLGYEAAYLLSRIATPATVNEWISRGEERTVKHLREEVEAAELLIRMEDGREQRPLDEPCLDELFELERCIVSGELSDDAAEKSTDEGWHAGQMSRRRFGRVTLRWVVRKETHRFFRALDGAFARVRSRICRRPASFVRFLCENFCRIWMPKRERPRYFEVYRRDVFRCSSPVCTRRDLTPHHLRFRAWGGGDDDENVASLCVWCHLRGVHEGRIRAEPPASRIRWRIGRRGTLVVEGRTKATGSSRRARPSCRASALLPSH